ncbi:hypothetical protein [Allocoleopsis franciscana]|uniref:Uncharacterized protein n=1 Tax=Allocoleopsis franciscana PCC 7113 TaxID=1173027 RepID=K9WCB5_9CYAN|nr:hypothetical protein [Allocoleopsis franciscana]AFZ18030.1 hypothetical protein Mic7113_2216 [Allocoleopsis franciscana PCC 7113]
MSDCWTDEDYNEVLSFVEKYLWLFVQENAAIHKPEQIICNLAQLNRRELRLLQLIYFLLSESLQKSVKISTPQILRRLAQSTDRMTTELKGSVRGNIDWNLTLKRRLGAGFSNPTVFMTRVAVKTYNLPEMQALKYLLTQINHLCLEVLGNIPEEEILSYESSNKWKAEIRSLYHSTNHFLKNTYLREIDLPIKITDMMLQKVRCARNTHFKNIYRSLRLYRRLFVQEEQETLKDCFSQGVLKPLNRDTLYEVYILFVTMASLEQTGWIRENFRLIGYGKGAVAQYKHSDTILRIYYQTLPTDFVQNSLYTELLRKYQIEVSVRRPDIILEFQSENFDFKILEVKRTRNRQYITESVYKVLGYLKDFERCFLSAKLPHAILVIWEGVENTKDINDVVAVLNYKNYQHLIKSQFI